MRLEIGELIQKGNFNPYYELTLFYNDGFWKKKWKESATFFTQEEYCLLDLIELVNEIDESKEKQIELRDDLFISLSFQLEDHLEIFDISIKDNWQYFYKYELVYFDNPKGSMYEVNVLND